MDNSNHSNKQPLKIRPKGEDGYRLISIRLREDILKNIDDVANQTNRSRNELINRHLEYASQNVEIDS